MSNRSLQVCLMVILLITSSIKADLISDQPHTSIVSNKPFTHSGVAVALSGNGNVMAIGSYGKTSLYVFSNNKWQFSQTLSRPKDLLCTSDPAFGNTVALSKDGNTLVVGASGTYSYLFWGVPYYIYFKCSGVAVYQRQNQQWRLQHIVTDPAVTDDELFGASLALSGDGKTLLVGAEYKACTDIDDICGAAYFFRQQENKWTLVKMLNGTQPVDKSLGFFGSTTALSQNGLTALIGYRAINSVWSYSFKNNDWQRLQVIKLPKQRFAARFGNALALSQDGSRALIAADNADNAQDCPGGFDNCGAVFSYRRNGKLLQLESSFTALDRHENNYFGETLALTADGTKAAVGTSDADCAQGNCGAVYFFQRQGIHWQELGRITSPTAGTGGFDLGGDFGSALGLSDDGQRVIVGADSEDCPKGEDCGAAYFYTPLY
ncbi:hypothetical protein [Methylocucumis oryzae]|nr:hypothetical protein [Methylocucumis oryzae]